MDILWSAPDQFSVRDVYERLGRDRELAYTTVMTVLDRLAKKGLAVRNLENRAWLYRPASSRAATVSREVLALLSQLTENERREVLAAIAAAPAG